MLKVSKFYDRFFHIEKHRVTFDRTSRDAFGAYWYLFVYLQTVRPLLVNLKGNTCFYNVFKSLFLILHEFGHAFKDAKADQHLITVGYWTTHQQEKVLVFYYGDSIPAMLERGYTRADIVNIAIGWGRFQMSQGDIDTYNLYKEGVY